MARLHLRKVAEQGHEIRNGPAGATGLLVSRSDPSALLALPRDRRCNTCTDSLDYSRA